MSDIKNKTVSIYIDQSAAEAALDKLQTKADGFNKKIDDCRKKQAALNDEIKKATDAAQNVDKLTREYDQLEKEIEQITKAQVDNASSIKEIQDQVSSYSERIDVATTKQSRLNTEIQKADEAGKSTVRLQTQYKNLESEITVLTDRLSKSNIALTEQKNISEQLSVKLTGLKQTQKNLNDEIKDSSSAANSLSKLEKQYNSVGQDVVKYNSQLEQNIAAQNKIKEQVEAGILPSINQQRNYVRLLTNEYNNLAQGTEAERQALLKLRSAQTVLSDMEAKVNAVAKAQNSWLQEAKIVAFGVLIGNTVQQAIGAIGNYLSGIVTGNAKLSDSLADLQRVTGASAGEVKNLYTQLKNLDTRTSTSDLLNIAIVAGKLGVAKDDIASFTQAVDKLQVALGDELGDADQITEQLGKILNVFDDGKVTGDNITKLGNAIVDLANKGIASGPFLVDFAQRVSGVAKASNLSLPAVLGLASGLEASGAKVESASTAVQKLIVTMGGDLAKAAQIANVPLEQFQQLFAEKPQEALLQYAAGLQKNKASFDEVVAGFKDAGEDGQKVISVLSTLGVKTDYFREQMQQAGDAIKNTDEIQDAFNLKNETLGAQLDKLGKAFNALITSKSLSEFFASAVGALNKFIDALKAAPEFIKQNTTGITLLVTGLVLMNETLIVNGATIIKNTALKIINATVTKLLAVEQAFATTATTVYTTVLGLLTGNLTLATAATRIFAAVTETSLGPLGALIALIGGVVIAISAYTSKAKELTSAQQVQAELQKRLADNMQDEKKSIQDLLSVATDMNNSYESRKAAIDELIKKNPEYLSGLDDENTASQRNINTINDYITHLDALARAKALVDIKTEAYKKKLESDVSAKQIQGEEVQQNQNDGVANFFHYAFGDQKIIDAIKNQATATNFYEAATKETSEAVDDLNKKIEFQEKTLLPAIKNLEAQGKVYRDITGNVIDYTTAVKNLNELKQQRNIYQGLPEDTGLVTSPSTSASTKQEDETVAARRAALQKLIDDLKTKYELLNATDKKGQDANYALQQKYQKELDELNHSDTQKNQGHYDELLKAAQEFNKKVRDLQQGSSDAAKTQNQKEIDDIKHKYDEVLIAYNNLVAKLKGTNIKLSVNADGIKALESNEIDATIKKQQAADFEKVTRDEYAQALADSDAYYASLKAKEAQRFVDGEIDYKTYQADLLSIDEQSKTQAIQIAIDYAAAVKNAEADVTKYKKEQLEAQVAAMTALYQKQIQNAKQYEELRKDTEYSNAQTLADTSLEGGKQQFEAKKKLLDIDLKQTIQQLTEKREAEITSVKSEYEEELKITLLKLEDAKRVELAQIKSDDPDADKKKAEINQRYQLEEASAKIDSEEKTRNAQFKITQNFFQLIEDAQKEHDKKTHDAQVEYLDSLVDKYANYASAVVGIFDKINQVRNAKDEAAFNAESSRNDALKKQYQGLLNGKLITQQEYNSRTAALDAKLEKDKQALAQKEFERNKKVQIANTLINAAAGAIKLWIDPGFPTAIPMEIVLAAQTAAEIAVIASQKPQFEKGGVAKGATHAQGGIKMVDSISGHVVGEMENNEPYMILSDNTYKNNKPVVDALLHTSMYNGGATIEPNYFTQTYRPIATGSIVQTYQTLKYASGGVFQGNVAANNSTNIDSTLIVLLQQMHGTLQQTQETLQQSQAINVQLVNSNNALNARLQKPIEANVSLKKLNDAQDQQDRILANATFG